jgi:hypothetical protein
VVLNATNIQGKFKSGPANVGLIARSAKSSVKYTISQVHLVYLRERSGIRGERGGSYDAIEDHIGEVQRGGRAGE